MSIRFQIKAVICFIFPFVLLISLLFEFSCSGLNTSNPENEANSSYEYLKWKFQFEQADRNFNEGLLFYRNYLTTKRKNGLENRTPNNLPWRFLGPDNIYGRTLCLGISPKDTSELWMGSACSGLWHSKSGGIGQNAWNHVPLGYPVQAISAISIHDADPNIIYVGTGETYTYQNNTGGVVTRTLRGSRGIGLLKTRDGGKTWNLSLDLIEEPSSCIWKICINPHNNDQVFIAGTMGVMRSDDAGLHWEKVLDSCLVTDLEIDPEWPDILYAGIGGIGQSKTGLYKSENSGNSWIKLSSANLDHLQGRIMIDICKENPEKVVAAFADSFQSIGILRTIDRFDKTSYWTPTKDVCEHQGWYANGLLLKKDDPSKLLMGGVDLYYDSSGTGNKLYNLVYKKVKVHADFHDILSNPLDPKKVYFLTDGGLFRSNDFGNTTVSCNSGYVSTQFYTGSTDDRAKYILGGLQDNKTALYRDSGIWQSIGLGDGTFNAFHPYEDSVLYISSQFQNLYISKDFGQSTTELIAPNTNAGFVSPFIINGNLPGTILSGGDQLWTSHDDGKSWKKISYTQFGEKTVTIAQDKWNPKRYLIACFSPSNSTGSLYEYTEERQAIVRQNYPEQSRYIRAIQSDPLVPKHWYMALGNYGRAGILESTNDGNNWEFCRNEGLPEVPFHVILIDPAVKGQLYAGCDLGLFVSFDGGEHWQAFNDHPYDMVPVYDIKYTPSNDELILFTHGYGVYSVKRPQNTATSIQEKFSTKIEQVIIRGPLGETSVFLPQLTEKCYLTGIDGRMSIYHIINKTIDARLNPTGLYILTTPDGIKKRFFLP